MSCWHCPVAVSVRHRRDAVPAGEHRTEQALQRALPDGVCTGILEARLEEVVKDDPQAATRALRRSSGSTRLDFPQRVCNPEWCGDAAGEGFEKDVER